MSNTIDSQILSDRARAEQAAKKVEGFDGVFSVVHEEEEYIEIVAIGKSTLVDSIEDLPFGDQIIQVNVVTIEGDI